jgi:hypothetical protein
MAKRLAALFRQNFAAYEAGVSDEVKAAAEWVIMGGVRYSSPGF